MTISAVARSPRTQRSLQEVASPAISSAPRSFRTQRRLLRIKEAVEYVNGTIAAATFRQWIWRRRIEHVRIGRSVCIPADVLDRLIEEGTVPAREER